MGIPTNLRVPFLYAEFNNENAVAGPQNQPFRVVMVGPKLVSGTKPEATKHLITSYEQAKEYFGEGSLLADMAGGYIKNNTTNELHCIALDDNVAAVVADGSFALGGAPTKAGVLKVYIAGKVAEVAVASGQALAAIQTALNDVIGADDSFLVASAVDGVDDTQLNFTAKNKGLPGNEIDIRVNFYDGDETPAGLTTTIVDMANGAANPDIDDAIAAFGDDQYLLVVSAFTDSQNIGKMETELTDRFGPLRQNDGYGFYSAKGTLSELVTLGDSFNSQFTTINRASGPTHPAIQSSAKAGVIALNGQIDPARPFQTLEVQGILPESEDEIMILTDRNILLYHGIATSNTITGGKVIIERIITTYKTNNAGADDVSYLDLNTLLTLSYLRYDWRNYILRKYPRHKLANDGTKFSTGQKIMTPKLGKAEAIAKFREWEFIGLVEGLEQFKEALTVVRPTSDVNRLDFGLAPDLVNQLRVIGTTFNFLL